MSSTPPFVSINFAPAINGSTTTIASSQFKPSGADTQTNSHVLNTTATKLPPATHENLSLSNSMVVPSNDQQSTTTTSEFSGRKSRPSTNPMLEPQKSTSSLSNTDWDDHKSSEPPQSNNQQQEKNNKSSTNQQQEIQMQTLNPNSIKLEETHVNNKNNIDHDSDDEIEPEDANFDSGSVTLIAFINFNSGGKRGKSLSKKLIRLLGEKNVFDLASGGPEPGLSKFINTPNLRVIVCGGDGSANWCLSSIQSIDPPFKTIPPVGIIPLGTGNDTSREFGWGHAFPGFDKIKQNLQSMAQADVIDFDRWHVQVNYTSEQQLSDNYLANLPKAMQPLKNNITFQKPDYETKLKNNNPDNNLSELNKSSQLQSEDNSASRSLHSHVSQPQHMPRNLTGQDNDSKDKKHFESDAVHQQIQETGAASGHVEHHHKHNHKHGHHDQQTKLPSVSPRAAEFNNYLSFGLDAQIMTSFHHFREEHRRLFISRLCNMAWMTTFGAMNAVACQAKQLKLQLLIPSNSKYIDKFKTTQADSNWRAIVFPEGIKAIVLLNLNSYAGGRPLWGKSKSSKNEYSGPQPSVNDGMLEVIGIRNSGHLGLVLALKKRGVRIAQVEEMKIRISSKCYVQLDGEPWKEQPFTEYHIRKLHTAKVLNNKK